MLPITKFVVFGEALTDFIQKKNGQWHATAGGACWNVARSAARLGIKTGYAGSISNDIFGKELYDLTKAAGLDMRYLQQVNRSPLIAIVTSTSPPDYFFVGDNSADLYFQPSKLPINWLDTTQIIYFGCISLTREPLASCLLSIAIEAAKRKKRIAFDPNWRKPMNQYNYQILFKKLITLSSYIKVSDEDLIKLFPGNLRPLGTLQALAPQAEILLTRGVNGMLWIKNGKYLNLAIYPVKVIDTIGCGDAAMGGWISSMLRQPRAPIKIHLKYAAACAALSATKTGAYAGTWKEVQTLINTVTV